MVPRAEDQYSRTNLKRMHLVGEGMGCYQIAEKVYPVWRWSEVSGQTTEKGGEESQQSLP